MTSKAQTEIIGLVIIMVLVVMGILFTMTFLLGQEQTGLSEEFKNADLPQSTLDAILATSSYHCDGQTNDQVIRDCAINPSSTCESTTTCNAVHDDINAILTQTLKDWGVSYAFIVQGASVPALNNLECSGLGESRTGYQQRSIRGQNIEIQLRICG